MGKGDPNKGRSEKGQQPRIPSSPLLQPAQDDTPIQHIKTDTNIFTDGMGGSGNGGTVAGSGKRQQEDPCAGLIIITTLNSPVRHAIDAANPAKSLTVTLHNNAAVVINHLGEICGAVANSSSALVACLKQGISFEADILKRDKGECQVRVHNAY